MPSILAHTSGGVLCRSIYCHACVPSGMVLFDVQQSTLTGLSAKMLHMSGPSSWRLDSKLAGISSAKSEYASCISDKVAASAARPSRKEEFVDDPMIILRRLRHVEYDSIGRYEIR